VLAVGTAIVVLSVSGVAWAYWTTGGSGTGSARVVAVAPGLRLRAITSNALWPGTSTAVGITADNASATALHVSRIHLVGITADDAHADCAVADFSMIDTPVDAVVPPHTKGFALITASLAYANTSVDQSACQGATLTLSITSD